MPMANLFYRSYTKKASWDDVIVVVRYVFHLFMSPCSVGSLQPIFSDAFDSKTFATQIIQYQAVGETLGKLESSITKLDDELYRQVCVRACMCACVRACVCMCGSLIVAIGQSRCHRNIEVRFDCPY